MTKFKKNKSLALFFMKIIHSKLKQNEFGWGILFCASDVLNTLRFRLQFQLTMASLPKKARTEDDVSDGGPGAYFSFYL